MSHLFLFPFLYKIQELAHPRNELVFFKLLFSTLFMRVASQTGKLMQLLFSPQSPEKAKMPKREICRRPPENSGRKGLKTLGLFELDKSGLFPDCFLISSFRTLPSFSALDR